MSFIVISCFPQSPVPPPSPMLILLRCLRSLIILSPEFSLLFSSQFLSATRRHPRSVNLVYSRVFPCFQVSSRVFVEFSFSPSEFSSSSVSSFSPALVWFWFLVINPLSYSWLLSVSASGSCSFASNETVTHAEPKFRSSVWKTLDFDWTIATPWFFSFSDFLL